MITATDETFLRRALRVAMNGRGRVEPNPMVGCVIVRDGAIIGEGHHAHFGGPHAEPAALSNCRARGHDPRGATAYVTLEPCCHTNKKTPPCVPRLIEAAVARVVVGCLDPNPDVDGKGVGLLRAAGVTVDLAPPELAALFRQLIAPFSTRAFYTTVKWAESADGYVAGVGGMPIRITSAAANAAVHRLRTRSDAIAVGIGTVLSDDPQLTVRGAEVLRRPARIVLDRGFRMPLDARLLADTQAAPVVILIDAAELLPDHAPNDADPADVVGNTKVRRAFRVRELGGRLVAIDTENLSVIRMIETANVVPIGGHLMIEAGPRLARAALPAADRLWRFISSDCLHADASAPRAAPVPRSFVETGRLHLGPDTLIEYLNRDATGFTAATPSADFVLEAERS